MLHCDAGDLISSGVEIRSSEHRVIENTAQAGCVESGMNHDNTALVCASVRGRLSEERGVDRQLIVDFGSRIVDRAAQDFEVRANELAAVIEDSVCLWIVIGHERVVAGDDH